MFPITSSLHLPQVGTSSELPQLDFKVTVNPSDTVELAKDIAAMANAVGGSIVVGAATNGQVLSRYLGIDSVLAAKAGENYERAAERRCSPRPSLQTQFIRGVARDPLLIVNVWMSPAAPVGVRTKHFDAWLFPQRIGSQTSYLNPDQFGSFEDMSARRVAALLLGIPDAEKKDLRLLWTIPANPGAAATLSARSRAFASGIYGPHQGQLYSQIDNVFLDRNVAHFMVGEKRGDGLTPLCIPLDCILTVYRDDVASEWKVFLECRLVALEHGNYAIRLD